MSVSTLVHGVAVDLFANYGEVHIAQVGATLGLLSAFLWRRDRPVSLAVIGLCTGLVATQLLTTPVAVVESLDFRIGKYPAHFLISMYTVAIVALCLEYGVQELLRRDWTVETGWLPEAIRPSENNRAWAPGQRISERLRTVSLSSSNSKLSWAWSRLFR